MTDGHDQAARHDGESDAISAVPHRDPDPGSAAGSSADSRTTVHLLVQRQALDEELLAEFVAQECALLGLDGELEWTDDAIAAATGQAGRVGKTDTLIVVTTAGQPDLTGLPAAHGARTIRVDVATRDPDRSPGLQAHIQGRGIDGVRWALRTACHHARWPVHTLSYGTDPEQFGELRLPAEQTPHPPPVVVLLHGGFWRSRWQLDLMDALAVDLARRGLASWNVEYRRPDRHGWAATVGDVHAAIDYLGTLAAEFGLDDDRAALVGHSTGGQLAATAAADLAGPTKSGVATGSLAEQRVRPSLLVQLAGLVDLMQTHSRDLGNGAVPAALGGDPAEVPEVYAQASPILRLPIRIPQLVVIGRSDSPDLREMSRRYVAAAGAAGDRVDLIEGDGDHFTVIDPGSLLWQRTVKAIIAELAA